MKKIFVFLYIYYFPTECLNMSHPIFSEPHIHMAIIAPSGGGKSTYVAGNILMSPFWDQRIIFTDASSKNNWAVRMSRIGLMNKTTKIVSKPEKLGVLLSRYKAYQESAGINEPDDMPKTVMIFDDYETVLNRLKGSVRESFEDLVDRGRHLGIRSVFIGHNDKRIPKFIRTAMTHIGIMKDCGAEAFNELLGMLNLESQKRKLWTVLRGLENKGIVIIKKNDDKMFQDYVSPKINEVINPPKHLRRRPTITDLVKSTSGGDQRDTAVLSFSDTKRQVNPVERQVQPFPDQPLVPSRVLADFNREDPGLIPTMAALDLSGVSETPPGEVGDQRTTNNLAFNPHTNVKQINTNSTVHTNTNNIAMPFNATYQQRMTEYRNMRHYMAEESKNDRLKQAYDDICYVRKIFNASASRKKQIHDVVNMLSRLIDFLDDKRLSNMVPCYQNWTETCFMVILVWEEKLEHKKITKEYFKTMRYRAQERLKNNDRGVLIAETIKGDAAGVVSCVADQMLPHTKIAGYNPGEAVGIVSNVVSFWKNLY